jgi:hypothetical protein
MKANFYIHGVPKGQDVWGSEQDRDYIKSFYSASYAESVRFVVEIIPAKKRAFYTYLRAKNVFGSENREGSYLGMTISLEGVYCTDNESLFALFDTIFNKRIIGSILQSNSGNLRFTLPAFDGKSKELESLQSEFLKQLDSFAEDLEKIDSTFTGSANGQIAYYNTSEVDSSNFFSVLKQTLKVYISPEYATKDAQIAALKKQVDPEKVKNKQLSEDNAELEVKLSAATEKGKRNDAEIASLRSDKQKLEEENKGLRNENASLKSELERNKAKSSIERSVGQIKQPLEELLRGVRKIVPTSSYDEPYHHQHHSGGDFEQTTLQKALVIARDVVMVVILFLLIGLTLLVLHHNEATTPLLQESTAPKPTVKVALPPTPPAKPHMVMNNFKDGDTLEPGKEYIVTLVDYPQGKQIKWRIDGATIPDKVRVENVVKFVPLTEKDTVYLTCCINDNGRETVIERKKWQIKKQ